MCAGPGLLGEVGNTARNQEKEAPASCAAMEDSRTAVRPMGIRLPDHSRPGPPGIPRSLEVHEPPAHDQGIWDMEPMAPCPGKSMGRARESGRLCTGPGSPGIHGQGAGIQGRLCTGPGSPGSLYRGPKSRQAMHRPGSPGNPYRVEPGCPCTGNGGTGTEGTGPDCPGRTGTKPVYSMEQVNRLSQDEGFSQLLYIAQKLPEQGIYPQGLSGFRLSV